MLLLCLSLQPSAADLPDTKRVNSVKSLTHILSLVEEAQGEAAKFTTMKLQIRIEDVYISQGDAVVLRPADLSAAIGVLLEEGKKRSDIARIVLRRYEDGEFHDR